MDIELLKSADVKEYFSNLESIKLIDCDNMFNSIAETVKRKFEAFKELVEISLEGCVLDEENSVYNEYFFEHYVPKLAHCKKELFDYIDDCHYIKNNIRNKLHERIVIELKSIGFDYNHNEFDQCFNRMYDTSDLFQIKIDIKTIFEWKLDRIIIKKQIRDIINSE